MTFFPFSFKVNIWETQSDQRPLFNEEFHLRRHRLRRADAMPERSRKKMLLDTGDNFQQLYGLLISILKTIQLNILMFLLYLVIQIISSFEVGFL